MVETILWVTLFSLLPIVYRVFVIVTVGCYYSSRMVSVFLLDLNPDLDPETAFTFNLNPTYRVPRGTIAFGHPKPVVPPNFAACFRNMM